MNFTLIGFLIGFATMFFKDMEGLIISRKEDPNAPFNWALAFCRWAQGGLAGTGAGMLGDAVQ